MQYRGQGEQEEEDTVVEGEDAQGPARIEVEKEVMVHGGPDEDAGDKKSGEGEEDIHAADGDISNAAYESVQGRLSTVADVDEVAEEDH